GDGGAGRGRRHPARLPRRCRPGGVDRRGADGAVRPRLRFRTEARPALAPWPAGLGPFATRGGLEFFSERHGTKAGEEASMTDRKASTGSAKAKPGAAGATAPKGEKPVLLSGGNPQIPKGEGDAPVQAY